MQVNLLDVVNFVDGVIGAEDPQFLLHPVKDQSLPMMMFLYSQTFSKDSSAIFQSYILFLFNTTCFGSCPVHV